MDGNQGSKVKEYVSFGLKVQAPASPVAHSVANARYSSAPMNSSATSAGYVIAAPAESPYTTENLTSLRGHENGGHTRAQPVYDPLNYDDYLNPSTLQKDIVQDTFADMVSDAPHDRPIPLVVLDCANIGWNFGMDSFDARGVEIAIKYFHDLKVEVVAFIPASYLRAKPRHIQGTAPTRGNALMVTEEVELLQSLLQQRLLTVVPTGDSDDAYILNYARDNNGFVISNDLFNDHLNSLTVDSVRRSMRVWLSDHRCGYTFTNRLELVFNPTSELRSVIHTYQRRLYEKAHTEAYNTSSNTASDGAMSAELAAELSDLQLDCSAHGSIPIAGSANHNTGATMPAGATISGGGLVPARSIYSVTKGAGIAYSYHDLSTDPPGVVSSTAMRGALDPAIHAVTAAIQQLCTLPGCPVPPYGQIVEAVRIGVTAVGDGRVAGLTEADSLGRELSGLLLVRAGLLEKAGYIEAAKCDLHYLLQYADASSVPARELLLRLS